MKEAKAIINDCLNRGWLRHGDKILTPEQAKKLNLSATPRKRAPKAKRTGNTDDELNIRNKARHTDQFTRLIEIELGIPVWPEFRFTTDRNWRFDYCIPEYKIAIECEGGIYTGGRHVRGKGYAADMEKYSRAAIEGWCLIRVQPVDLITTATIEMIKKAIENCKA